MSELIILCLHSAYDTNEDTHQSWGRRSLCCILALFRMLEALLQNAFIRDDLVTIPAKRNL